MVTLMRKNDSKTNEDSFDAKAIKSLLGLVMGKAKFIIDTVKAEKPKLEDTMYDALFAKFAMPDNEWPGKLQHCEKLVDIWFTFEQCPMLMAYKDGRGARRSTNFSYFITSMKNFGKLEEEKVTEDSDRQKIFKSEPKPPGESDQLYLEGGGFAVKELEYPCCPNPRCGHAHIDQPPGNATLKDDNVRAVVAFMEISGVYSTWKKKLGPQPKCPETGALIDKAPKAPKALKLMLRCHCSQNGVDPRQGKKCWVNCTIGGMKYGLGQCPMCGEVARTPFLEPQQTKQSQQLGQNLFG